MLELPVLEDGLSGDWAYDCYGKGEVMTVLHTKAKEDVEEKNGTMVSFFIHLSGFHFLRCMCSEPNPPPTHLTPTLVLHVGTRKRRGIKTLVERRPFSPRW
jgi:hypothetical protein